MDRQSAFLLALGFLIVASALVSVSGWILFVRDRHATDAASTDRPEAPREE